MASPTSPSGWRLSDEPPEAHERVFEVAPEEDLLYSLGPDGKRRFMHPQLHRGRTWRQRLVLGWALVALFFTLPIVPVGGHNAAGVPSSAATRACSALVVGSSPNWSSPTGAAAMAARMPAVGRVTVSERRSMGTWRLYARRPEGAQTQCRRTDSKRSVTA